jgi:hypothetical protein
LRPITASFTLVPKLYLGTKMVAKLSLASQGRPVSTTLTEAENGNKLLGRKSLFAPFAG